MPLGVIRSQVSRRYGNFRGIDLLNPEASILPQRSPDCLNVWKSYDTEQSNIIQSRPGVKEKADYSSYITGIADKTIYGKYKDILVHEGSKMLRIDQTTPSVISTGMNTHKSIMLYFKDRVHIVDGTRYAYYHPGTRWNGWTYWCRWWWNNTNNNNRT